MERSELTVIKTLELKKFGVLTRIGIITFGMITMLGTSLVWEMAFGIRQILLDWIGLAVIATVVILHELSHGIGFAIQGYPMKFGMTVKTGMGPMFFSTSPGSILPKVRMIYVLLAPQVLTIVTLIATSFTHGFTTEFLVAFAAYNLGGGCADLYVFLLLLKLKGEIYVEDTGTGGFIYRRGAKPQKEIGNWRRTK